MRSVLGPNQSDVLDFAAPYILGERELSGAGSLLEVGRSYLIPLKERLELPRQFVGIAAPTGATARADVRIRLLADTTSAFDRIAGGYRGPLYLQVVTRSFPLMAYEDLVLGELRLIDLESQPPDPGARYPVLVDLSGSEGVVGYKARRDGLAVDSRTPLSSDPSIFWEEVEADHPGSVLLHPNEFYLLQSNHIEVPGLSVMRSVDPTGGLLDMPRLLFHDDQSWSEVESDLPGHRIVLPIRTRDVPFALDHGAHLGDVKQLVTGGVVGNEAWRLDEGVSQLFRRFRKNPS
jgi:dCTP deaminase